MASANLLASLALVAHSHGSLFHDWGRPDHSTRATDRTAECGDPTTHEQPLE